MPAQREDTIARGDFAKCICKHIDVWFNFVRELGLGVDRMEEIILVTGRDLARSWTNVAFSENQGGEQVSFGVQVTGFSNVEWQQISLEDMQGVALNRGPSGQVRSFSATLVKRHSDRHGHIRIYRRISAYLSGVSVSLEFSGYYLGLERQGQLRVRIKMNLRLTDSS